MLEDAGCRVVYGLPDHKVHSKLCVITRRHRDGTVSRITQIGTGNYNEVTGEQYTDISLITSREEAGLEAEEVFAALENGLCPIMCVGESLEQRETGITAEWIAMQIKSGLAGIGEDKIRKIIIAYEPIWAIGTGKTATPEQAEEVCEGIRAIIRKLYGAKVARAISILYGGSMNEKNAYDLLAQPDIDGGLIGGASLVPEKFVQIIEAANQPTA
jgi:triosephosphate isomerase